MAPSSAWRAWSLESIPAHKESPRLILPDADLANQPHGMARVISSASSGTEVLEDLDHEQDASGHQCGAGEHNTN